METIEPGAFYSQIHPRLFVQLGGQGWHAARTVSG
jgi:hypothetical protein